MAIEQIDRNGAIVVSDDGGGGGSSSFNLQVKEIDGSPSVGSVTIIRFPNGTITDDGFGQVTISFDTTIGGDLSGPPSNATVIKFQNRAFASTAPSGGQVITWNNASSQWIPATPSTGSGAIACRVKVVDATFTAPGSLNVGFNVEDYDTDNMHSNTVNNDHLTANTAGYYHISANVLYHNVSGSSAVVDAQVVHNSGALVAEHSMKADMSATGVSDYIFSLSGDIYMAVSDFVQLLFSADVSGKIGYTDAFSSKHYAYFSAYKFG